VSVPTRSRSRRTRRRRVRPLRLGTVLVLLLVACGYATVWAVPPLRALVAGTLITTRHAYLAHLFATPAEFQALRARWLDTPNVSTVTAATYTPAPAAGGGEAAWVQAADGTRLPPYPGVTVHRVAGSLYRGWVLLVRDPAWVHVGVTKYLGVVGQKTSEIGARYGAVAAVNGGGFQDAEGGGTGGLPVGLVATFGKLSWYPDLTGDYVIGLDRQNRLVAGKWNLAQAKALGIRDAVSFKPLLVVDGRPMISSGDGGWGIGPRTAIGQRSDGTLLFVVIDGRQVDSLGATLRQVQDILLSEGAVTGANLDGGSSTTLWYRGHVVNAPCCSPNGLRPVPTAFVVVPGP
jgi:exopolysaccharide biosynthesis protein